MAEIRNVELLKAGTWRATAGPGTFTPGDLDEMVRAHADTVVDQPAVKIGHDPTNPMNSVLGDAEPAFGWIANVTRGDGTTDRPNADSLYGDLVGMPDKLATVAPRAWRRRSAEVAWGVKTATGKTYRAVLTGVALLGTKKPAVKGLADVLALYSELDAADDVSVIEIVDGLNAEQTTALSDALDALTAFDTATVPQPDPTPTDAEPDPAARAARTVKEPAVGKIQKKDLDALLESARDLAADADVTDLVTQGLNVAVTEPGAAPAAPAEQEPVLTAASAADQGDTVTLTREQYTALSEGAAAGMTAAGEIAKTRRQKVLDDAVAAGKISPAEVSHFAEQLETNETSVTTLIGAMAPRFPVSATGHTHLGDATDNDDAAWNEFHASISL